MLALNSRISSNYAAFRIKNSEATMIPLANVPTVKDSDVYFTLNVKGGIQRYQLIYEALTDLARVQDAKDGDLLGLFEIHKDRIIEVAERQVGQPGPATIRLDTWRFN